MTVDDTTQPSPNTAAVPDVGYLLNQMDMALGTWNVATELANTKRGSETENSVYSNSGLRAISTLPPAVVIYVLVAQSCLTLCDPMTAACHGILQARILVWISIPFYRGSS